MSRTTIGSRWNTPGRHYAGGWRQNPWINAMRIALEARHEPKDNADWQQRAAVRTWENEGGSLGTHPGRGR